MGDDGMEYMDTLQHCALFANTTADEVQKMLCCLGARTVHAARRETLISEGDPAQEFGIVLSGSVQIVRVDYDGNRSLVDEIEPSGMFCETFACADAESVPVDVVVKEEGDVMFINCRHITQICGHACSHHQQMIYNLMRAVAERNLQYDRKLEILSKRNTRDKLMTYLAMQAKRQGRRSFEIPYDRQELADYLEVERSGLSAEIGKLRREGILKAEKNRFTIL
jgi:CRP-like cAMP-binding protein